MSRTRSMVPVVLVVLVVGAVALVVAVVVVLRATDRAEAPDVAGAPVGDLCAAVPPDLLARVVPVPVPTPGQIASRSGDTVTPGRLDSRAACAWSSGDAAPQDRYGSLEVAVVRHGAVGGLDAAGRAREAYDRECAGPTSTQEPFETVAGLGDAACRTVARDDQDTTVFVELRVRRGLDVFRVRGFTHPGEEATSRDDATAVADALLAAVR